MRALTIKQPWAAQIAYGIKKIDYRAWKTDYRGPILITASAGKPPVADGVIIPTGCTVCVVDLVEITGEQGDYQWHLSKPRPVKPIRVKGKLNLWEHTEPVEYLPKESHWLQFSP